MPAFIIADFSIIFFALGLFIFFWAAMPLIVATGTGIATIVRNFPAIGDDLADWIMERTHDVERTVQDVMQGAVHAGTQPFVDLMNGYANNRRWDSYYQRIVTTNIVGAMMYLAHAQQNQVTQPVVNTVNHAVSTNIENTNNYITQVVGVSQQYVDVAYNQLAGWANDAIQSVYQDVLGADAAVNALGDRTEEQLQATLTTSEAYAVEYGQSVYTQATDYTQSVASALSGHIDEVDRNAEERITKTQEWTQGLVDDRTNELIKDIGVVSDYVATAIYPAVTTLVKDAEECYNPMCENGLDFMKGLGQLDDILSLAGLFGIIASAAHDPEGVAHGIAQEIDDLTSAPRALFAAITGR